MKLYTLLALIASAAAIRVSLKESIEEAPMTHVLIQESRNVLSQCGKTTYHEWLEWLRAEAASDDGLTWPEFKEKLTEILDEHG